MFKHKNFLFAAAMVLAAAVFYGGYLVGLSKKEAPVSAPPSGNEFLLDADLSILRDSIALIKEKYFKADEISDQEILYGAVEGVVESLGDPYSVFFSPEDAKKFEEDINGSFGGIGAEIGIRDDQLIIVSPLKGNPAEEVGLKAGDKILKIDDTFTNNISLDKAVKLIRGEEGTDVTLLILRKGWDKPKEFVITRRIIQIPTLDWEMQDGKIAYIQLYSFNANAPQLFYKASFEALLQGPKGLILDLRNNSGGFLDVANNIAGWFLNRGDLIVQEKFPSGRTHDFIARGNGAWGKIPVVILVNGGSASASEILAGALRDHLGAVLVGEKTFGKGTVQEVETLSDGSKIKISVAEWVLPSGKIIEGEGLEPDVVVEITEEDVENERDPQFEEALRIIREKSAAVQSIPTLVL